MTGWLVTQGDRQFQARDLSELKQLAASGEVGPGDMVQPPGANDWLYASELEDLKGLFPATTNGTLDDDWEMPQKSKTPAIVVLAVLAVAGAIGIWHFSAQMPSADDLDILGPKGLQLTEMLVLADATVRAEPSEKAAAVASVKNGEKVQLLAKRNKWYTVKTSSGVSGYLFVNDVMPAYVFADNATKETYDPIFNPDRYVFVKNSSWMQLPDQREQNITLFQFQLQNTSKFAMEGLTLVATIKDKNDRVLERKEIKIKGTIPRFDAVMVGTLMPPDENPEGPKRLMTEARFRALAAKDPSLTMRWSEGVEVHMESEGFVEANIDLLEVRAVPRKP